MNDTNLLVITAVVSVAYNVATPLKVVQVSHAFFPSDIPDVVWTGEFGSHFGMKLTWEVSSNVGVVLEGR